MKPFYYAEYRGGFYFASEQKALFASGVPASFDRDVWAELLCFRLRRWRANTVRRREAAAAGPRV